VGVLLIRMVLEGRFCGSSLEIFLQVGICGGGPMSLSAGSVGESGGFISLLGDAPPRVVSVLANLSLFKLMLAMYVLVLLSKGELEFPRGRRLCWLVDWHLSVGLETLALLLAMLVVAAAASDHLATAMLV
jgi:hypothetical protein